MTNPAHSEISLRVNEVTHHLPVDHRRTLLDMLREDLGLSMALHTV
ncbi:hypothetical protein ACIA5G_30545 [Amycolatopsis sp. NPDC051758]